MENIPAVKGQTESFFSSMAAFEDGQRIAKMLMQSKIIPETFRNNLADCVIALEMSNRVGVNPIAVMQNLYIVHGKPSWSAQFIVAVINQSGRYKSSILYDVSGINDDKGCIAYVFGHTGERVEGPRVTIKMAKAEGWMNKNPKWSNMEDLMLRYRAATFFGRLHTPDLLMGMQTKEELDDVIGVKQDGNVGGIDISGLNALSTPTKKTKKEEENVK